MACDFCDVGFFLPNQLKTFFPENSASKFMLSLKYNLGFN